MERMMTTSTGQQVASYVMDASVRNQQPICGQMDLNWSGFRVNMEYYSVTTNRVLNENVQRMYRNEGKEAHAAMSLLAHLEPKILSHSGFLPFSSKTIKVLAGETGMDVPVVEKLIDLLVTYQFFDLEFVKQDILTSVGLQRTSLRYGFKVPKARVRIPLALLLLPFGERTDYCVAVDTQNHRLVRPYTKKKYAEIYAQYEDEETMQLAIDDLAPRLCTPDDTNEE